MTATLADMLADADPDTLALVAVLAAQDGPESLAAFMAARGGEGSQEFTESRVPPRPGLVWKDSTHRWINPDTGEDHNEPSDSSGSVKPQSSNIDYGSLSPAEKSLQIMAMEDGPEFPSIDDLPATLYGVPLPESLSKASSDAQKTFKEFAVQAVKKAKALGATDAEIAALKTGFRRDFRDLEKVSAKLTQSADSWREAAKAVDDLPAEPVPESFYEMYEPDLELPDHPGEFEGDPEDDMYEEDKKLHEESIKEYEQEVEQLKAEHAEAMRAHRKQYTEGKAKYKEALKQWRKADNTARSRASRAEDKFSFQAEEFENSVGNYRDALYAIAERLENQGTP